MKNRLAEITLSSAIDHRLHGQLIKFFNIRRNKWDFEKHINDHEAFQRFVDADLLHSLCSNLYTEIKTLLKVGTITASKPEEAKELFFQCTMALGSTKTKVALFGKYNPYSPELISISAQYLALALSDFNMCFAPLPVRKLHETVTRLATAAQSRYEVVTYSDTQYIN